eukprot:TRINITY_DN4114_c0_g2_i2.p1 TRINITY_DN4114_c0_g2~~TRINITY_DN4114_c0_g2_i2.p1  ORF type:complete len:113 (+),score=20.21 TRINITY_DN4114_c0_g2_i2:221-559(+)
MGQRASTIVNKLSNSFSYHGGSGAEFGDPEHTTDGITRSLASFKGGTPFVYSRQGSMYFDEDGDLAHEFYEEIKKGGKRKMKRIEKNLRPQGEVKYRYPRLHVDFPIVLYSD